VVLLELIFWAYRIRKRIVILAFADHTGKQDLKACVDAIAPRLYSQLALMRELYRVIDDAWPTGKGDVIEATVSVTDVAEALQSAVSPESKIKLASFLEIPLLRLWPLSDGWCEDPG
jgi:hypothetical protein